MAGEAGIRVNPGEPASVAAGLRTALERREALRLELPERARAFTWSAAAGRIESLWGELS